MPRPATKTETVIVQANRTPHKATYAAHIARPDYLPDVLWPLCRNGMGSTQYEPTNGNVTCRDCIAIAMGRPL